MTPTKIVFLGVLGLTDCTHGREPRSVAASIFTDSLTKTTNNDAQTTVNSSKIHVHLKDYYYLVNSPTQINNSAKWLNILH